MYIRRRSREECLVHGWDVAEIHINKKGTGSGETLGVNIGGYGHASVSIESYQAG